MKIAFFSTQQYDKEYFTRYNTNHELVFFEAQLNEQTVSLADGCGAVCAFVNDVLNASVIKLLAAQGIHPGQIQRGKENRTPDPAIEKELADSI